MPRTKKRQRKISDPKVTLQASNLDISQEQNETVPSSGKSFFGARNILFFGIIILAVLAWRFRGYIIIANVNGQMIPRWELSQHLMKRFGQQTLDNLINERLILSNSRQKGIFVTQDEINARVSEIEQKLQGQSTLAEALTVQGLTEDMFRSQLEVQIAIEKLFEKEASVSAEDIDDYIKKNAAVYQTATDQAQVREEVQSILKQQKVSDSFNQWFEEIRKNASVQTYL